jgi:hypothetical protein
MFSDQEFSEAWEAEGELSDNELSGEVFEDGDEDK